MIELFRKIGESWIGKILAILIIIGFFGVGLGPTISALLERSQSAIVVGSSSIAGKELLQQTEKEVNNLMKLTGNRAQITIKDAVSNGMLNKVIKNDINSLLYQSMEDDLDLVASDQAVGNYIVNNPLFQTATGTFDRSYMMAYLQQMQMSEQAFVRGLREELARKHLTEAIKAVVIPPQLLKDKMYDYLYETRDVNMLLLSPNSIEIKTKPDKETLQSYYDSMEDQLYAPEYRKINLLKMTMDKVMKNVVVDDETLKQMYEDRKDNYTKAEQRHVEQILLKDEQQANEIYSELTADNFASVAKEKADQDDVDLGWIEKKNVVEEVGEAAFDAKVGQVLKPVKTVFGYHILIVREVKPAEQTTFEQAKEELTKIVQAEKTYNLLVEKANSLDEALGEGIPLENATKRIQMTLDESIWIDANGVDKKGKESGLPVSLVQEVFLSKKGNSTALYDYQDGYIVAEVQEIEPSYLRPFDEVQEELKTEWVKDQQKKEMPDFAQKILVGAQHDKLLKTVALVYHLTEEDLEEVKRSDFADLPAKAVEQLFNAKQNDILLLDDSANDEYWVAQIKKVQPADKTDEVAQMNFTIDLKQKMTDTLTEELLTYYGQKEGVKINQAVIDETFKPYMDVAE
ncbi:MAG: peptidyl-prolyl cis-trans isomerase [Alphaproteobacteria bacterium]|nr:peptidyl-prolyl cis-trans isomerase [Alphaproteobacteria bacterium]